MTDDLKVSGKSKWLTYALLFLLFLVFLAGTGVASKG
jgi:hypothetical protein